VLHDDARPGQLSAIGGSFAAGVLRQLPALCALTAPSVISAARLVPHRWSAGFRTLGIQNREAAVRICPAVAGLRVRPDMGLAALRARRAPVEDQQR
jgi:glutamine synthetase